MATARDSTYCKFCDLSFSNMMERLIHEGDKNHCLKKYHSDNPQFSSNSSSRSSSPASFNGGNNPHIDFLNSNFVKHDVLKDEYTCTICNIFVSGFTPFEQHILGSKHTKKLKIYKQTTKVEEVTDLFKGLEISEIDEEEEEGRGLEIVKARNPSESMKSIVDETIKNKYASYDGENVFTCHVCSTFVTGLVPFQAHITGSKHQKKLKMITTASKLREMNESYKDLSEIFNTEQSGSKLQIARRVPIDNAKSPENLQTSFKTTGDVTFPFVCEPCAKKFTGEEPFLQHLDSVLHLKKVKRLTLFDKVEDRSNQSPKFSQVPKTSSPISTSFTTPIVDDVSMNGTDPDFPYVCHLCAKKFTGEDPFKQHLESSVHEKKVQLAAVNKTSSQLLSCGVCQLTFSGPIPFQDHLNSIKHEKQVRKATLYGNLQECGPVASTSDDDNVRNVSVKPEYELWRHLSSITGCQGSNRPEDIKCIKANEPITL